MRVKVSLGGGGAKTVSLKDRPRVDDLLRKLGINPETVIVMRNGKVVLEEEMLEGDDDIRIVPVK